MQIFSAVRDPSTGKVTVPNPVQIAGVYLTAAVALVIIYRNTELGVTPKLFLSGGVVGGAYFLSLLGGRVYDAPTIEPMKKILLGKLEKYRRNSALEQIKGFCEVTTSAGHNYVGTLSLNEMSDPNQMVDDLAITLMTMLKPDEYLSKALIFVIAHEKNSDTYSYVNTGCHFTLGGLGTVGKGWSDLESTREALKGICEVAKLENSRSLDKWMAEVVKDYNNPSNDNERTGGIVVYDQGGSPVVSSSDPATLMGKNLLYELDGHFKECKVVDVCYEMSLSSGKKYAGRLCVNERDAVKQQFDSLLEQVKNQLVGQEYLSRAYWFAVGRENDQSTTYKTASNEYSFSSDGTSIESGASSDSAGGKNTGEVIGWIHQFIKGNDCPEEIKRFVQELVTNLRRKQSLEH